MKSNAFKDRWCSCYDDRSHLDFAGALSLNAFERIDCRADGLI